MRVTSSLAALGVALLAACGEGGANDGGSREAQVDGRVAARVCGWLEDQDGARLASIDVILCTTQECLSEASGASGAFCVVVAKADDYLLHVNERGGGAQHTADVLLPMPVTAAQVAAGDRIDVGRVVLPRLGATAALDLQAGGTLGLGGGDSLTVPANAAKLPPLVTKAEIALAAVDPAQVHPRLLAARPGATARAVFALVPLGATFSPPATYRLSIPGGTPGAVYELFVADPKTGQLALHGEAKVVAGATGPLLEGELRTLSWLLFYPP
jgi:hypothetical protein